MQFKSFAPLLAAILVAVQVNAGPVDAAKRDSEYPVFSSYASAPVASASALPSSSFFGSEPVRASSVVFSSARPSATFLSSAVFSSVRPTGSAVPSSAFFSGSAWPSSIGVPLSSAWPSSVGIPVSSAWPSSIAASGVSAVTVTVTVGGGCASESGVPSSFFPVPSSEPATATGTIDPTTFLNSGSFPTATVIGVSSSAPTTVQVGSGGPLPSGWGSWSSVPASGSGGLASGSAFPTSVWGSGGFPSSAAFATSVPASSFPASAAPSASASFF